MKNDFGDGYRSKYCHTCRCDFDRLEKAKEFDEKQNPGEVVQEVKCQNCEKRFKWWYFAKLPLRQEEITTIMNRPDRKKGKAW